MAAYTSLCHEVNSICRDAAQYQLQELSERVGITSLGLLIMTPDASNGNLRVMSSNCPGPIDASMLKLYFFHEEDRKILAPEWENNLLNGQRAGAYTNSNHLIVLPLEPKETQRFQSCRFIHELGHALEALRAGRASTNQDCSVAERTIEEAKMMAFDCELRLALGGKRFKAKVDQGAETIGRFWKAGGKGEVPSLTELGSALSLCYGAPPSIPETIEKRRGLFLIHCSFVAADRFLAPTQAKEYKHHVAGGQYK